MEYIATARIDQADPPGVPSRRDVLPGESWISTPREHGEQLHGGGRGMVALCSMPPGGRLHQRCYPVEVALEILGNYGGRDNAYISMQRFSGLRRIAHLLSLSSMYVDLDYYNSNHAGLHPYQVLELAMGRLETSGVPSPTLAISSGNGLYLIWQHEHVRRTALPRWNACQRRLMDLLSDYGADRGAGDAARILRLVGTTNVKRKNRCSAERPVESLLPVGDTYDFDGLANAILPYSMEELRRLREARRRAEANGGRRRGAKSVGAANANLRTTIDFTSASLWEARLTDLEKLRDMRFMNIRLQDYRSRWLFWAGVAMSWLVDDPATMRRELHQLAYDAGGWHEGRTKSKLSSLVGRTLEAYKGQKVEYAGRWVDPRYRARNQTIIDWLDITPEEERRLDTIISDDERRRRDREAKRQRRRREGMMIRSDYEDRAANRRDMARRLSAEGVPRKEIASRLGVSVKRVSQYLAGSAIQNS